MRKKRINTASIVIISLLSVVFVLFTVNAAEKGTIKLTDAKGKLGSEIKVEVDISNNPGFISANLYVNYDDKLLKLKRVEDSGVLPGKSHSSELGSPYSLAWINDLSTVNFTNEGKIAELYFEITGDSAAETKVSLNYDIIDKDLKSVAFDVSDAKIVIDGGKKQAADSSKSGASNNNTQNPQSNTDPNNKNHNGNSNQGSQGFETTPGNISNDPNPGNAPQNSAPPTDQDGRVLSEEGGELVTDEHGDYVYADKYTNDKNEFETTAPGATSSEADGGVGPVWFIVAGIVAVAAVAAVIILRKKGIIGKLIIKEEKE